MWRNTDQRLELKFILGPKMAPKLGLHIPHKSKSTSNEHVKECQCEISENIWESEQSSEFYFMVPFSTHLWK